MQETTKEIKSSTPGYFASSRPKILFKKYSKNLSKIYRKETAKESYLGKFVRLNKQFH